MKGTLYYKKILKYLTVVYAGNSHLVSLSSFIEAYIPRSWLAAFFKLHAIVGKVISNGFRHAQVNVFIQLNINEITIWIKKNNNVETSHKTRFLLLTKHENSILRKYVKTFSRGDILKKSIFHNIWSWTKLGSKEQQNKYLIKDVDTNTLILRFRDIWMDDWI